MKDAIKEELKTKCIKNGVYLPALNEIEIYFSKSKFFENCDIDNFVKELKRECPYFFKARVNKNTFAKCGSTELLFGHNIKAKLKT